MNKEKVRHLFAYVLGFKPVKTMRHRLVVIVSHALLWGIFLTLPLFIYRVEIADKNFIYRELINKLFLIALFYFNYYYLLPRFFQKRRIVNYFLSILAAMLVLCIQQVLIEIYFLQFFRHRFRSGMMIAARKGDTLFTSPRNGPATFSIATPPVSVMENRFMLVQQGKPVFGIAAAGPEGFPVPHHYTIFNVPVPKMMFNLILMNALTSGVIILLISGFIKLANSFVVSEKQKKILENDRLHAELNFLKLQINPHFLFNTLNSIYSQAHFKSEQTEYSILKFSQIMRYVLYDSMAEKISLSKDLEYISNYIHLQKIRLSKNITIDYKVTGSTYQLLVAPLLLITFIENAFKHGISYSTPSKIKIDIRIDNNTLTLEVGNAKYATANESTGGVGLLNAQRRLDVLYPGRYLLDVVENDHLYIVNLKIELDYEN